MQLAYQIGAERRAADFVERRDERALRRSLHDRFERGEQPLAIALAERDKAHARRNEIGRYRVQEGVQRGFKRYAVACGRDPDRHRVGRRPSPGRRQPVERRTMPRRAGRLDERRALRRRLQMALLRRRKSRGQFGDGLQGAIAGVGQ